MLTNQIEPTKVMIPHEDGEWMSFGPLSWSQLQEARRLKVVASVTLVNSMPAAVQDRLDKATAEAAAQTGNEGAADEDEQPSYDQATVLRAAIKGWSYDAPVTPDNIDALDEQTAEWAFDTAIAMNQRSRSEGEGSAPSSNGTISEMGAIRQN